MTYFGGYNESSLPQYTILAAALTLAGYDAVADATLAVIDSEPGTPADTKHAIRAMAYRMATYNGGTPDAGTILHTIATATWEAIGLPVDGVTALTTADRGNIIEVIMAVSKSIISAEAARLTDLAGTDTALPEGWAE